MHADLLIYNIGQLVTLTGAPGPRRGAAMRELGSIEDAALAVADGRVSAVGRSGDLRAAVQAGAALTLSGFAGVDEPNNDLLFKINGSGFSTPVAVEFSIGGVIDCLVKCMGTDPD